ncbi:MAG: hypothetical protein NUV86_07410 [Candidatus Scalindua sp.]|nr:hypothetical protein [Candidatus Scalindua sp.]
MTIPDYQTVMLPLLEHLGDKEEKSTRETLDALASRFNLTEEEKKELLPCGQQPIFSKEAQEYASLIENKIVLIDGEELSTYMIDLDIGVSKVASYEIKRVDSDYFTEE